MNMPLSRKNMELGTTWRYSNGEIHAAHDYRVPIGTPIFAVRNGVILHVRDTIKNMPLSKEGKSGDPANFILQGITYKGELATVAYVHVSPNVLVKPGDRVEAGQQLGLSGYNGHATGPHLHIAAMTKHRSDPFEYLNGIPKSEDEPENGVASNGICIFPPRLVFPRERPHPMARGRVVVADLKFGTRDSDSVRRLQHRLNGIPLEGGVELSERGNYLEQTRDEVRRWQLQKRGLKPGSPLADGDIHPKQAQLLFGKRFELV